MQALFDLYQATDGDHWILYNNSGETHPWIFSENANPCTEYWQGLTCTNIPMYISSISLTRVNLTGYIPASIGNFSHLGILNFYDNPFLSGTIPPEIGKLQQLSQLIFREVGIVGSLPKEVGYLNASLMVDMQICDNPRMSGSIPPEIGNLVNLRTINMYESNLQGSVPSSFGNLKVLKTLTLYGNLLSGSLSPELGGMTALTSILLGCPRDLTGLDVSTD